MKKVLWEDVKNSITSISETEKQEIELLADIMCEIIKRRKELKISQRELEKLSGVKQEAISRIESMKNVPQLDTLIKLMKPLGLELCIRKVS